MSDSNKYEGEENSLKSLYEYYKQNDEYDGVAQEWVEDWAKDLNQRQIWDKLDNASTLDAGDGHGEDE